MRHILLALSMASCAGTYYQSGEMYGVPLMDCGVSLPEEFAVIAANAVMTELDAAGYDGEAIRERAAASGLAIFCDVEMPIGVLGYYRQWTQSIELGEGAACLSMLVLAHELIHWYSTTVEGYSTGNHSMPWYSRPDISMRGPAISDRACARAWSVSGCTIADLE